MPNASPPINRAARGIWPLLIEALAGAATGVVLAVGGGYLGPVLVRGFANGWNDLVASVLGALGGYIIGAPLGVIISARLLNQRGVAWRAVLGSVLGGVAIMLLAEPLRLNQQSWLLMLSLASAALIGALWGFQPRRTRKRREAA
jgi:hypothetical protein